MISFFPMLLFYAIAVDVIASREYVTNMCFAQMKSNHNK